MTILWASSSTKDFSGFATWKTTDSFPAYGSVEAKESCHVIRATLSLSELQNPHMTFREYVMWVLVQHIRNLEAKYTVAPEIIDTPFEKVAYEGFEMSVFEIDSLVIADAIVYYADQPPESQLVQYRMVA